LRSPQGRSLAETCKWLKCLPSELYEKHNPTMADLMFIAGYTELEKNEEREAMQTSIPQGGSSGGGGIMPHIPYKRGSR